MRFAVAVLAAIPVALAEISILAPSTNEYWVQNTSNTITWSYSAGDPNPININVLNKQNTTLNGDFTIAQFVNVSQQSFTVTNVTLVVGGDYAVEFVNPSNESEVYATSQYFSVRPPAVTAAAASVSTSSAGASSTASASGSAGAAAASSSSPSSASGSATAKTSANAAGSFNFDSAQGVIGVIVACGIASLSALLL